MTDGWDSCDNHSLINSAFISNNDGGVFWRSVDTSGKVKNADYTAALMINDIYSYGPLKVVLVCTDTCAVMQRAWEIVMCEFPWISCLPCQPHVISLLLKDIGKTPEVSCLAICMLARALCLGPSVYTCQSRQSQSCTAVRSHLHCLLSFFVPPQVTQLVQEESIVTRWFSNHHFPLSKLREMTLRELGRPLVRALRWKWSLCWEVF